MRELRKAIWPYKVSIQSADTKEIEKIEYWLGRNVGSFKIRWNIVYHFRTTDFYFKSNYDLTFFALKWL
jgi:hypothetical protein